MTPPRDNRAAMTPAIDGGHVCENDGLMVSGKFPERASIKLFRPHPRR